MNTAKKPTVLIVGAGIAGLTAYYWLNHYGFQVDIIEKHADHQHRQGYMIDFWGPGYDVAEKMAILPQLEKHDHHLNHFIFLSDQDKPSSYFSINQIRQLLDNRHLTFQHGDLETALLNKINTKTIDYHTTIKSLQNTSSNVSVTFNNDTIKTYDLVIGADGVHSKIRNMIFGDETKYSHDLGYELAAFMQENNIDANHDFLTYATAGKQVSVCPTRNNQLASYYVYRSEETVEKSREISLINAFKDTGWQTKKLTQGLINADSKLFDRLIQIKMKRWHKDRIVLLGDACQCMTLFAGQGASLAMAGAYTLATLLNESPNNIAKAFAEYEKKLQPHVTAKQNLAEDFLLNYVPISESNIPRRSYFTRQFFKKMYQVGF